MIHLRKKIISICHSRIRISHTGFRYSVVFKFIMFPSTKAFYCIACLSYVRVHFLYTYLEAGAVRLLRIHGNLASCHHQGHRHTDAISGILTNLILNQNWGVRDRKFPISIMANTKQSMRNVFLGNLILRKTFF